MHSFCCCNNVNKVEESEVEQMVSDHLQQLSVNGFLWRTLYKCRECEAFWEERYTGGRWNGGPELFKVDSNYVLENWGSDYI